MPQTIGHISLLVRDYDEAIAFFTKKLGFELIEDSASIDRQGGHKRWVVVSPHGSRGTNILLLGLPVLRKKAESEIRPAGASFCFSTPTISGAITKQ